MVTFITATLWIAVFSYLMVWLVSGGSPCPVFRAEVLPVGKSLALLTSASLPIQSNINGANSPCCVPQ